MAFELRLGFALGKTLSELRSFITSDELPLYAAYEQLFGFPLANIQAVQAMSGAAFCQTMGAKVQPRDLLPRMKREEPHEVSWQEGANILQAMFKTTPAKDR